MPIHTSVFNLGKVVLISTDYKSNLWLGQNIITLVKMVVTNISNMSCITEVSNLPNTGHNLIHPVCQKSGTKVFNL